MNEAPRERRHFCVDKTCTVPRTLAHWHDTPQREDGAALIAAERRRQVEQEGWTAEHDAAHAPGTLLRAAHTYCEQAYWQVRYPGEPNDASDAIDDHGLQNSRWPWAAEWWKPSEDPVRNLVKAGALIAAEIDRLRALTEDVTP